MVRTLVFSFFLGFILSSPLGPMGLICLRRTLTRGRSAGLTSALGISLAYGFWSYVAIHGLTAVSSWVEQEKNILEFAIALFFFLYGLHGIFNTPDTRYPALQNNDNASGFLPVFLVVFLNPSTFIMFVVLFTLFGVTKNHYGLFSSLKIVFSVFIGSVVFWITLSKVLHKVRKKLTDSTYILISRLSSCFIMIFGIIILLLCLYEILSMAK